MCNTILESCIEFGLLRDPTQILQERAILPLLRAGAGGKKILRETSKKLDVNKGTSIHRTTLFFCWTKVLDVMLFHGLLPLKLN